MEVTRIVSEDPQHPFSLDLGSGLAIAFHENPVVRGRFVTDLLAALGPGRDGLHAELVDDHDKPFVIFRPADHPHRVIAVGTGDDVTDRYRRADGSVSLLGSDDDVHLMVVRAKVLEGRHDQDAGKDADLRRLAAANQGRLWQTAAALRRNEEARATSNYGVPEWDTEELRVLTELVDLHHATDTANRATRPARVIGSIVATAALVAGLLVTALSAWLGTPSWLPVVLFAFSAASAALTGLLRRRYRLRRRAERLAFAEAEVSDLAELDELLGPLRDRVRLHRYLALEDAHHELAGRWKALAGAIPVAWALAHRADVEHYVVPGSRKPTIDSNYTTDTARHLAERVTLLQMAGPDGESLPLVLDEPFAGAPTAAVTRLLDTVLRLSAAHQIVLVTGDPLVRSWAEQERLQPMVRVTRLGVTAPGVDAAPAATAPVIDLRPVDPEAGDYWPSPSISVAESR